VGASDAWVYCAYAAELKASKKNLCVITAEAREANRLLEEMRHLSEAFELNLTIAYLPDWETLPYDHFSPHPDLISERLLTCHQLGHGECDVLLVSASTAAHRLAPRDFHAAHTFIVTVGQKLNIDALRTQLITAGYHAVSSVLTAGEYAIRGGLIDLFPMGAAMPYRIDLFDDEVDSIKTFNVDTQRTLYAVPHIRMLPAREFPMTEEARTFFRQRYRELIEGDPSKNPVYQDVSKGIAPGGIEYFLPCFFARTDTLFDYLPKDTCLVEHGDLGNALSRFNADAQARFQLLHTDQGRSLLAPTLLFLEKDQVLHELKQFARLRHAPLAPHSPDDTHDGRPRISEAAPNAAVDRRQDDPIANLKTLLRDIQKPVVVMAESSGRRDTLNTLFHSHSLHLHQSDNLAQALAQVAPGQSTFLVEGTLQQGFCWLEQAFVLITETELFPSTVRKTSKKRGKETQVEGMLRDLSEVRVGDPVVHEQHGIGRYMGLISLDLGDGNSEFLHLAYANDTKLYVPVNSLHLISRYSGADPEHAPLHSLGNDTWEKQKRKAAEQAHDTAAELLNLYAQRAARQGHAFAFTPADYDAFCEGFAYEETADQAVAIHAVMQDLLSAKPMDRLVCGDVGFGKTEVAMRAAFIALMDGRQVALLVPTTLLAEQHYENFKNRLAQWPLNIAELSRFRSAKEISKAVDGLADGSIDLVIGTHKLIQDSVQFKRLGLVIIDEEHRFGVRQKEQLKKLRASVDVLTLTATPIPRSLAMSMEGLRDFSVIATAPEKRLAIKTFLAPMSDGIIREACLREIKRGGQVYFLHNEIDSILNMQERLQNILPEASIRIGHGQMGERELEAVMRDFYHARFQILLCSTIIETGIDVANANTILINRADRFGLAQLHQLRGRVGRSHHQAYAYLLTPPKEALTPNAKKRLEAITQLEELGSGFFLAMHDLEIRGAGEVLGDKQSGQMQTVGFQLYTDMLNHAVKSLKAGKEPDMNEPLGVVTEVNLHTPALLPNEYCPDVHERLVLYKRLASCQSLDALDLIREEIIDRFGKPLTAVTALIGAHELRIHAHDIGIVKIDSAAERSIIHFSKKPAFEPLTLIKIIQNDGRYRFAGQDKLRIERSCPDVGAQVSLLRDLISRLRKST
jgi:transcription-repair coupling factor (superfamily II helicase)